MHIGWAYYQLILKHYPYFGEQMREWRATIRKNQKQTICLPYANAIKRLFLRLWNYRINGGRAKVHRRIIGGSTFFRHFRKLISRLHENSLLHTFFRRYSKILPQFLSYNKKMCYICTLKLIHNIDLNNILKQYT